MIEKFTDSIATHRLWIVTRISCKKVVHFGCDSHFCVEMEIVYLIDFVILSMNLKFNI